MGFYSIDLTKLKADCAATTACNQDKLKPFNGLAFGINFNYFKGDHSNTNRFNGVYIPATTEFMLIEWVPFGLNILSDGVIEFVSETTPASYIFTHEPTIPMVEFYGLPA
jgi:hypothetical protein